MPFCTLSFQWLLLFVMSLFVVESTSVCAADWTVHVNSMITSEERVNESSNQTVDISTCILEIREQNIITTKSSTNKSKQLNLEPNTYRKVNAHQQFNVEKTANKYINEFGNLANSSTYANPTIEWNTKVVPFAEWHQQSSSMYTTTGVLHLALESFTNTSIRLIVYIGTSSDLFCYCATLDTRNNKNESMATSVLVPKVKEKVYSISRSSHYSQNSLEATMRKELRKNGIFDNVDDSGSVEVAISNNKYKGNDDSLQESRNIEVVWAPSSLAFSCERHLSEYLQSQLHYTASSFENAVLPNGSYKYYFRNTNFSNAHSSSDAARRTYNIENKTVFSTKPPCILTRVDRFEHILNFSEQAITNNNINCWYNTSNKDDTPVATSSSNFNTTLHCDFTLDVTIYIPNTINTNTTAVPASANNNLSNTFALKVTAAAVPVTNVDVENGVNESDLHRTKNTSTQKSYFLKQIATHNPNVNTDMQSQLLSSLHSYTLDVRNRHNVCTNVSLSPQFWQLTYPDNSDDICAEITVLESSQVDDGLWRTSWLLLTNFCLLICIVAIVGRVYVMK